MIDSGTTINLFKTPNMVTNRRKVKIPMTFMTNEGSKIVDEVGEIPGSGQAKFHPDMIANVMGLNDMPKNNG